LLYVFLIIEANPLRGKRKRKRKRKRKGDLMVGVETQCFTVALRSSHVTD
jgi:hypothetical protein